MKEKEMKKAARRTMIGMIVLFLIIGFAGLGFGRSGLPVVSMILFLVLILLVPIAILMFIMNSVSARKKAEDKKKKP